jgi:cytochrome d ubiquinol oxidase subunit I
MTIAAFAATGFAVAGVHALMILRGSNVLFHTKSFTIAAAFGCVAALVQPLSGDISAKDVAIRQPAKLAAMEAHFHTEKSAPLIVGGIPNVKEKKVDYAVKLPGFLSFLAHGNFEAEVTGLDRIPEENHPPLPLRIMHSRSWSVWAW